MTTSRALTTYFNKKISKAACLLSDEDTKVIENIIQNFTFEDIAMLVVYLSTHQPPTFHNDLMSVIKSFVASNTTRISNRESQQKGTKYLSVDSSPKKHRSRHYDSHPLESDEVAIDAHSTSTTSHITTSVNKSVFEQNLNLTECQDNIIIIYSDDEISPSPNDYSDDTYNQPECENDNGVDIMTLSNTTPTTPDLPPLDVSPVVSPVTSPRCSHGETPVVSTSSASQCVPDSSKNTKPHNIPRSDRVLRSAKRSLLSREPVFYERSNSNEIHDKHTSHNDSQHSTVPTIHKTPDPVSTKKTYSPNKIFCSLCTRWYPKDSFSVARQNMWIRNIRDERMIINNEIENDEQMYCLKHTSTSSFGDYFHVKKPIEIQETFAPKQPLKRSLKSHNLPNSGISSTNTDNASVTRNAPISMVKQRQCVIEDDIEEFDSSSTSTDIGTLTHSVLENSHGRCFSCTGSECACNCLKSCKGCKEGCEECDDIRSDDDIGDGITTSRGTRAAQRTTSYTNFCEQYRTWGDTSIYVRYAKKLIEKYSPMSDNDILKVIKKYDLQKPDKKHPSHRNMVECVVDGIMFTIHDGYHNISEFVGVSSGSDNQTTLLDTPTNSEIEDNDYSESYDDSDNDDMSETLSSSDEDKSDDDEESDEYSYEDTESDYDEESDEYSCGGIESDESDDNPSTQRVIRETPVQMVLRGQPHNYRDSSVENKFK